MVSIEVLVSRGYAHEKEGVKMSFLAQSHTTGCQIEIRSSKVRELKIAQQITLGSSKSCRKVGLRVLSTRPFTKSENW